MVAYLGHSSLNPELSQFIVPKLFWPSSGTFQHHHQLFASEDTASCLLGRLDTHQRASLCGQLEFVSRTSLIYLTLVVSYGAYYSLDRKRIVASVLRATTATNVGGSGRKTGSKSA